MTPEQRSKRAEDTAGYETPIEYREAIRRRLEELGWKNNSLAIESGVAPATLSRVFKRQKDLTVDQLTRIARAMGMEPGDLLPKSERDPMLQTVAPLVKELRPLSAGDQEKAVYALTNILSAMKDWKPR